MKPKLPKRISDEIDYKEGRCRICGLNFFLMDNRGIQYHINGEQFNISRSVEKWAENEKDSVLKDTIKTNLMENI